jgi:hypothetical protein
MPQEGEKIWEGNPLTNIEKKEEEVSFIIHCIQSLLNPKIETRECI